MKRHSFGLEHLEGRTLFCVAAPTDTAPAMATTAVLATPLVTAASSSPLAGVFNVAGKFTVPLGNPDSGPDYHFTGTGKTTALGSFTMTGHIHLPGFIASARAGGSLTITTSKGTLTLSVHGPPQTPGSLPSFISYSIVKGTGSYVSKTGKGQIGVSASTSTHKFVFRFNQVT